MDPDLQTLLACWLGDEDPGPERRDALLARLREDVAFRQAFLDEIRLLGMLRAVQSAEPRWLRLEDQYGWSARAREETVATLTARVVAASRSRSASARRAVLVRWSLGVAAVLVAFGLLLAYRPGVQPPQTEDNPAPAIDLATAVKLDGVEWEEGASPAQEGDVLTSGRLRLRAGRLTLSFFSGVLLTLEGPADLELLASDRVFCHAGKLRARVPPGAQGFTLLASGYEVVDLGTELGLNLEPSGKSNLMVFKGEAAVSVLRPDGRAQQAMVLESQRSVVIDPARIELTEVHPQPDLFVPAPSITPPTLELPPSYPAEILADRPWGYWRFERITGFRVRNEVAERPTLRALGGVRLGGMPDGNGWALFRSNVPEQAFLMDGEWSPPREDGYAIECWAQAGPLDRDDPSSASLVSLILREESDIEKHVSLLEMGALSRRAPHTPCTLRFLDRWPAARLGGANAFSRRTIVPSQWHHLVGQKTKDRVELFVDGELVASSPAKPNPEGKETTGPCLLYVGRLKRQPQPPNFSEIRPFVGRLAELAVYARPLTADEIRRHFALRREPNPPPT